MIYFLKDPMHVEGGGRNGHFRRPASRPEPLEPLVTVGRGQPALKPSPLRPQRHPVTQSCN